MTNDRTTFAVARRLNGIARVERLKLHFSLGVGKATATVILNN